MSLTLKQKSFARWFVPTALVALLLLFYGPILGWAGAYLAPVTANKADVLVMAGNNVIDREGLRAGMVLLSQGRANRMMVVLLYPLLGGPDFVLEREYSQLIAYESHRLGLEERVSMLSLPIAGHPITLSEAKQVTDRLHRDGVRSAILLTEGFHTRRSIAAYRAQSSPLDLNIMPFACFTTYRAGSWWTTSKGISDFTTELSKFAYYLARGYLPLRSIWTY